MEKLGLLLSSCALLSCSGTHKSESKGKPPGSKPSQNSDTCPWQAEAPKDMPGTEAPHNTVAYWEKQNKNLGLDDELLTAKEVKALNASMQVSRKRYAPRRDLLQPSTGAEIEKKLIDRQQWYEKKLSSDYVDSADFRKQIAIKPVILATPRYHVAYKRTQMYCAPSTETIVDADTKDKRINRNACGAIFPQEPFRVVAETGDFALVQHELSWGWIAKGAAISSELPLAQIKPFIDGDFAVVAKPIQLGDIKVPALTRLPKQSGAILVATSSGIQSQKLPAPDLLQPQLTRRNVLRTAFRFLSAKYGFGGNERGMDCSRFLEQVLGTFGVELPRHSGWQAKATSFSVDVKGMSEAQKKQVIALAHKRGIVLLEMPGHIMLYLGSNDGGMPMAIHSMGHYIEKCADGGETRRIVDRVVVSTLELGRATSKTSFLERLTHVSVIGKKPGQALRGIAKLRPAAPMEKPSKSECRKVGRNRLFSAPLYPHKRGMLRVIATREEDPGPVSLQFFAPDGSEAQAERIRTTGPPWAMIGTVKEPARGKWMVVLGDGKRRLACRHVRVSSSERRKSGKRGNTVWPIRSRWSSEKEDLYSVFVERLFDYPLDQDLTWKNLHTLLRDQDRNVLYGYLGHKDEETLDLVPDCADLPYTLRAYFAWKLGLPFAMRRCTRGRDGRPPRCKPHMDVLIDRAAMVEGTWDKEEEEETTAAAAPVAVVPVAEAAPVKRYSQVAAFDAFYNELRRAAHSSSGRTLPRDEKGEFYPVPLSRQTIRPGMLFIDPFGHLLVVQRWVPQGKTGYGALMGVDAQPDGTVGRRRFWRGSFMFHPGTSAGGAGFKAFRPLKYSRGNKSIEFVENRYLKRRRVPYSLEQYEGTVNDFYDRMQSLINPRPLDPSVQIASLVNALEEQVSRRVNSVDNGEAHMKKTNYRTMKMPEGASIFLTSGPWEDFATPSRDWRLQIAIHTVADFPNAVSRRPEQYGIDKANAKTVVESLRKKLFAELAKRTFEYTRSDGSKWKLSLKDIVERMEAFQMAYNPNDCVEHRWGAPTGSKERATCKRQAPAEHTARMKQYRKWFKERRRPAM